MSPSQEDAVKLWASTAYALPLDDIEQVSFDVQYANLTDPRAAPAARDRRPHGRRPPAPVHPLRVRVRSDRRRSPRRRALTANPDPHGARRPPPGGRGSRRSSASAVTAVRLGPTPSSTSPRNAFHRTHASASANARSSSTRSDSRSASTIASTTARRTMRLGSSRSFSHPAAPSSGVARSKRRAATWRSWRSSEPAAARTRTRSSARVGSSPPRSFHARSNAVRPLPAAPDSAPVRMPGTGGAVGCAASATPGIGRERRLDQAQHRREQLLPAIRALHTDGDELRSDEHVVDLVERREDARDARVVNIVGGVVPPARAGVHRAGHEPDRAGVRRRLRDDGTVERRRERGRDFETETTIAPSDTRAANRRRARSPTSRRPARRWRRGHRRRPRSTAGRRRSASTAASAARAGRDRPGRARRARQVRHRLRCQPAVSDLPSDLVACVVGHGRDGTSWA